jgi:hypothetical protein
VITMRRPLHRWYLLLTVAAAVSCAHTSAYKEFAAAACPVSFHYPGGWHQQIRSHDDRGDADRDAVCSLVLDPPDWQSLRKGSPYVVEDHAISIEVTRQTFAEAAEGAGLSRTADGRWQIEVGRLTHPLAEPITTPYASGVRGSVAYRTTRKNGSGVYGTAESSIIVLSNGTYSAVITAEPLVDSAALESVVQSLKFVSMVDSSPSATLHIHARDTKGNAVPGVGVSCSGADPAERYTDAQGLAVFPNVKPGIHRLKAELAGLLGVDVLSCVPPEGSAVTVILNDGPGPCDMTITWSGEQPPPLAWMGRVVTIDLRPIKDVTVEGIWPGGRRSVRSASDGRFWLEVPRGSGDVVFRLSKKGYETRTTELSRCGAEMTLQMSRTGAQSCRTPADAHDVP